ncbi:hypothetical protein K458DRAFT_359326 [Lentithecium fluviatile CBS 122367]|uniref:Rhodopsin domain-containing protein n=1 Tax=Lentithecium fluviatile CBS 122367 TaxID=1168545 RepID=A0A6G1JDP4_9PLEO|nr:hypothetical protein K458DRAFT_359326 [Lentithecium fluviatile CBS 122367]
MSSAMIPPPTVINNQHKKYGVATGVIVLGTISTLFTVVRLWYRAICRTFGPDDIAIIPALFLYVGWTIMAVYVVLSAGVGKPLWEITLQEFSIWFKGIVGSAFLYPAMSASIRVSILLFYLRIFGKTMVLLRYAVWTLLAFQAIYVIVYSILPVFIAHPFNKIWHPLERGKYMNDWYYYYTQVALYSTSMAFDIILLFFPVYPVLQLQMTAKKRVGVIAMFMLGAAASVAAAYKLAIFVTQMERYTAIDPIWLNYQMSTLVPPQFDKYGTTFWIPSQVEPSVALIGAALPALRPLFQGAAQRVTTALASSVSSGTKSRGQLGSQSWSASGVKTPERSLLNLETDDGHYIELREPISTKHVPKN